MANVTFKLDHAAMTDFLKSKPVADVVKEAAESVLHRCPDIGYGMTMGETNQRARAFVGTRSVHSVRHNNKYKTLQKAIGGGG